MSRLPHYSAVEDTAESRFVAALRNLRHHAATKDTGQRDLAFILPAVRGAGEGNGYVAQVMVINDPHTVLKQLRKRHQEYVDDFQAWCVASGVHAVVNRRPWGTTLQLHHSHLFDVAADPGPDHTYRSGLGNVGRWTERTFNAKDEFVEERPLAAWKVG